MYFKFALTLFFPYSVEESTLFSPANYKTSDSDFSESETSRTKNQRHKQGKLRLSSILLIGLTAKYTEKRIFYGYWHSLFPTSDAVAEMNSGILICVIKDPNLRCRITALQTLSQILYGSRQFLLHAEIR